MNASIVCCALVVVDVDVWPLPTPGVACCVSRAASNRLHSSPLLMDRPMEIAKPSSPEATTLSARRRSTTWKPIRVRNTF